MSNGLTTIAAKKAKPGKNKKGELVRKEYPDAAQRGLLLVVFPSGKRSFIVRYRFNKKKRKHTLGHIGLAQARKLASDALFEVAQGRDPAVAKKVAKAKAASADTNTVKAVCERYLAQEGKKLRTAADRSAALERLVYPQIGSLPVDSLRRGDIIRLLDQIEANRGPVMADRTLAVIRKVLNWHAIRDEDYRSPIVRGMARTKPKERARSRTLTDHELRAIWKAAGEAKSSFPALVKFLLLTAARRTEAADMTRKEIDGADWTLPASRNKTKLDLVRPLSAAAQAVLGSQPEIDGCPYVFTTDGKHALSGFSKFKRDFDKACGVTGWTLHDLRRTARSLMSRAGVDADHAERCLGHVIAGVRGTYDKHEYYGEKEKAFEALATLIGRIVNPADNVTPMRRKGQHHA
jgi:integrase